MVCVTTGGAGDPASKPFSFGGQPSKPAAENAGLLGSRSSATATAGGFGSTGGAGTGFGSTGSAGVGVGSTGSAGAGFGSTGSAGAGFGSSGNVGAGFGSTGSAGAGFGSTGSAGAGFGSTGSAGAGFGSTGSAGAGFGSTGSVGAGFGSTSGGGSGQFSFSFKPAGTSATNPTLAPPVTSAGWCSFISSLHSHCHHRQSFWLCCFACTLSSVSVGYPDCFIAQIATNLNASHQSKCYSLCLNAR